MKSETKLTRKQRKLQWIERVSLVFVAIAISGFGVSYLRQSAAATPFIAQEAENGTILSPAASVADSTAAGSKAVKFAVPAAPPPPPSGAGCTINNVVAPCMGGPTTGASGWTLSFSDEFNGTSLDLNKWESTWFGEGSTMNNVGTYAANVSVSNGEARLQLESSSRGSLIHTGYKPGHYQYPVDSFVEARIYFPGSSASTLYNWSAWWANSTNNYPASGEHDIAEVLGTGQLTVNYHSPSGSHNQGAPAGSWGNAFHTYALHRQANKADVYWDGRLVKSYTTDDDGKPEDLIFNVGSGKGPTMTGSAGAMRIDYVRAWRK